MKKENQELVIILSENMENTLVRIIRNAHEEELVIKFIRQTSEEEKEDKQLHIAIYNHEHYDHMIMKDILRKDKAWMSAQKGERKRMRLSLSLVTKR